MCADARVTLTRISSGQLNFTDGLAAAKVNCRPSLNYPAVREQLVYLARAHFARVSVTHVPGNLESSSRDLFLGEVARIEASLPSAPSATALTSATVSALRASDVYQSCKYAENIALVVGDRVCRSSGADKRQTVEGNYRLLWTAGAIGGTCAFFLAFLAGAVTLSKRDFTPIAAMPAIDLAPVSDSRHHQQQQEYHHSQGGKHHTPASPPLKWVERKSASGHAALSESHDGASSRSSRRGRGSSRRGSSSSRRAMRKELRFSGAENSSGSSASSSALSLSSSGSSSSSSSSKRSRKGRRESESYSSSSGSSYV